MQLPAKASLSVFDLDTCGVLNVRNVQNLKVANIALSRLKRLDLSYCGIRSDGLEHISSLLIGLCNSLESLCLSGNFCEESSVQRLIPRLSLLEFLRELELASFCSSNTAFNLLLQVLTSNSLQALDISGNLLQAEIDKNVHNSLAGMLERCKNIRKLNLADNHLETLDHFGPKLTALEALNLERTELVQNSLRATLEYLGNCPKLHTLSLGCINFSTLEQEQLLAYCLSPQYLFLPNTSPSVSLFAILVSKATTLIELDLSGAKLSGGLMEVFAELLPDSLEVLNVAYTEWGDLGCDVLRRCGQKLEKLKVLNLGSNRISDEGVGKLMEGWERLSRVRILNLSGNTIHGSSFKDLPPQTNSDLTVLDLRKNPLDSFPSPFTPFPCLMDLLVE